MNEYKIILASASPRRAMLLRKWGLKFKVVPSRAGEKTKLKKPGFIVRELALRKALSVAAKLRRGLVIAADTIVVLRGEIIGKPDGEKHAEKMLSKLNGSTHRVYTGIAVIDASTGRKILAYDVSRVKMRRIPQLDIVRLSRKHMDKAGAYAIQEKSDAFVERVEGDYYNVVGLPYGKLKKLLSGFGVRIRK